MAFLSQNRGFSIVEVVVAAVIFAITSVGILTTISVFRQPAKVSERKVQAAFYAQRILEDLRSQVDQTTWNDVSSPLATGTHPISSGIYSGNYVVTADPDGYRVVNVNLNWSEP